MKVAVNGYYAGKAWLCMCVGVEPPFSKSWIRHCIEAIVIELFPSIQSNCVLCTILQILDCFTNKNSYLFYQISCRLMEMS